MKILVKNVRIINALDNETIENGEILISGERIEFVGAEGSIKASNTIKTIDMKGHTILPGIINSHVHILADYTSPNALLLSLDEDKESSMQRGRENLEKMLKSGVTYARDLGGYKHININLANERAQNIIGGAELISAGEAITSKKGHLWQISRQCDGVASVKEAVEEQIKAGAHLVKLVITGGHGTKNVHPTDLQFNYEEIVMAVETAHATHRKVSAHVNGYKAIKMAVEANVDCFEHCEFFPNDDPIAVKDLIAQMAEKKVFYVPTLTAWFKHYPEEYGYLGEIVPEAVIAMRPRQLDTIRPAHIPREYMSMQQVFDNGMAILKGGVITAMGTDSGIPKVAFDKYPFELKLMQKIGMTPLEIIKAATKTNAQLLGIEKDYGTLTAGKFADLIILKENPLENFDAFYNIAAVYKKGKLV